MLVLPSNDEVVLGRERLELMIGLIVLLAAAATAEAANVEVMLAMVFAELDVEEEAVGNLSDVTVGRI